MNETITVAIGRGRLKASVFSDAAVANGWTPTIEQEITGTTKCTYEQLGAAGNSEEILKDQKIVFEKIISTVNPQNALPTDTVTITYSYKETIDNPVSDQVFGAQAWGKICDESDAKAQADALKIRQGWAQTNTPTVVS